MHLLVRILESGSKRQARGPACVLGQRTTVRAELADLEAQGLLTHPHTSAGRLPTEEGYRYYANELLAEPEPRPAGLGLELAPKEMESALQQTTELLSDMISTCQP